MTAIDAGVPHVLVPQRADLILNARQLAAVGAGDFVLPEEGFEDVLREKVAAVLDGALEGGVRKLQDEMRQLPSPNAVAQAVVAGAVVSG